MESIHARKKKSEGYVYALLHVQHTCPRKSLLCSSRLADQDAVKIGYTCRTPERRQQNVESSETHHRLQLLYAAPVDHPRSMESSLHGIFRSLRIAGEWFRYDTTYFPKFLEIVNWQSAHFAAARHPDIDDWGLGILFEHFLERLPQMNAQMPLQTAMEDVTHFTPRKHNAPVGSYVFNRQLAAFFQGKILNEKSVHNI